jgi:hypothetical protein
MQRSETTYLTEMTTVESLWGGEDKNFSEIRVYRLLTKYPSHLVVLFIDFD